MYIDEIFSYNKKGAFNNAMLNATYIIWSHLNHRSNELGAFFYLDNIINIKINRSDIMA